MLTDAKCRNAKCPADKNRLVLSDGDSLCLFVTPKGAKSWYMRPRIGGKVQHMKLGDYPAMTLAQARRARDEAKALVQQGKNPIEEKRRAAQAQAGATFGEVAEEWFSIQAPMWSISHATRQRALLKNDLLPDIGTRPIAQLEPPDMLATLRRIEKRGVKETAHRALSLAHQVCAYAVATSRARYNICADLKGALKPRGSKHHFGAITEPAALGRLLHAIRHHQGARRRSMAVQAALMLAPMLFQRPGNLQQMRWEELDLASATWTIPSAKMKRQKAAKETGAPHIVPLARQAVAILERMRPFTDNAHCGGWVFPGGANRKKPLSDNALRKALLDIGVPSSVQTVHGFRATARTMLDEQLKCDWRHIEAQLAHSVRDALGRAYNRTEYLPERREIMQVWADYLDKLAAQAAAEQEAKEAC